MKNKKGITLISLVITIVIMLILAGVAISMVIGKNGLFIKTNASKEKYSEEQARESVNLIIGEWELDNSDKNLDLRTFLEGKVGTEIDGVEGEGPYKVKKDSYIIVVDINGNILDLYKDIPKPVISNIKVVANSNGTGDALRELSFDGDVAYITFAATQEKGTIEKIEPQIPFAVTKNGEYEFTVTGKVENNESKQTVKVNVNQFKTSIKNASWEDVNKMAKIIADDTSVTSDTESTNVTLNGTTYTLKVGDTKQVNGKTVRIVGFNHDELSASQKTQYNPATGKGGITFCYVDFLMTASMNSTNTNVGGWGSCQLRTTLNSSTINTLTDVKAYIKQVKKSYIASYNDPNSVKQCDDKLWLLSCSEMWPDGYKSGAYGFAVTKEGERYKYYKDINAVCNVTNNLSVAPWWWLRSASYLNSDLNFCSAASNGRCYNDNAKTSANIIVGFSI